MSYKKISLFFLLCLLTACTMIKDIRSLDNPRYEPGEQKGAQSCAECHQEIYDQWSKNSSHARALTTEGFEQLRLEFAGKWRTKMMGGDAACYACHGSKSAGEGVNCETCHGLLIQNEDIMYTHLEKYKPGRQALQEPGYCSRCHDEKNPTSGEYFRAVYQDWQKTRAAENGVTCQRCHMKPGKDGISYHGFDSAMRRGDLYEGDLEIKDIVIDFPTLHLAVENRVTGHPVPTGGPIRTLALEISFLDKEGEECHGIVQTFNKKYSHTPILKAAPYKLLENTQIKSGETRELSFSLPLELMDCADRVSMAFRFFRVLPEHQGDVSKAYWSSEPFLQKTINFGPALDMQNIAAEEKPLSVISDQ